ncbi:hypothetical protein EBR25_03415 [bacterium]|nr:hypothetical protein [bacterium]
MLKMRSCLVLLFLFSTLASPHAKAQEEASPLRENEVTPATLQAEEAALLSLINTTDSNLPVQNADSTFRAENREILSPEAQEENDTLAEARKLLPTPASDQPQEELALTIDTQQQTIESLKASKATLEKRLLGVEQKLGQVLAKLEKTHDDLLLAETEVERLSHIIEKRNIKSIQTIQRKANIVESPSKAEMLHRSKLEEHVKDTPTKAESMTDMSQKLSIATVTAKKANLRTGPGLNNSVLLTVSQRSRLVVEMRRGNWYRVIAPTGERAWISGTVIHFGPEVDARPNPIMRIRGFHDATADAS